MPASDGKSRPGGGRSRAGLGWGCPDGGSGRGARGRAQPSDRQTSIGQPLRQPSLQPASRVPGGGSAAATWPPPSRCRRPGLPRALGRNLGAGEGVRGVSVASAMLGTVTMAGKAVWHPGCRHTRLLPGLCSARAVRAAAAASRGRGGVGEPRSPSPQGYPTRDFLARALGVKGSGLSIFISVRTASKRRLLKLQEMSYRLNRPCDVVPVIRGFMNVEVLTGCFSAGQGYDWYLKLGSR